MKTIKVKQNTYNSSTFDIKILLKLFDTFLASEIDEAISHVHGISMLPTWKLWVRSFRRMA